MGKPTGFLDYERQVPADRPATERTADWLEFHDALPEETLRRQGARCMDCGIPFCHTGALINGMAAGCPINNLIPEWNDLVYRGRWEEALRRLEKTNAFPEFTGRVCPAPCEGSCTVGIHAPPVTIKSIEAAIADRGFAEGWIVPRPPAVRTGRRVAVVGSGPAGLACADLLNRAGHAVTVYERADRVGGLLMYGIPNMKLDKRVVQRRVDLLAAEGVAFVTNTEVGRDLPADRLRAESDAVVLCTGSTRPRDLAVPGRELAGVHFAMEFLVEATRRLLAGDPPGGGPLSAAGRDVIVIGGGDTGNDCVGTSVRQGARSVTQFEILPQPPDGRAADNPWPQWPRIHRVDYGQEEAAARFGADPRRFGIQTRRIEGGPDGRVRAVQTVQVEWARDAAGRFAPREVAGTERVQSAGLVLIAMGFLGPEEGALRPLGVALDARGVIRAEEGAYATGVPGVFAAGDARRGQSLVVWAIREGRGAARACDRYLAGRDGPPPGAHSS